MRVLLGLCWFVANVLVLVLLRPRDGREAAILRFPGAWIVVGLLLTVSFGASTALMAVGLGVLR
jgi:hypothetical protein